MVNEQRKAVHAFPYIDRSLPIADWNDPMWSTDDVQSGVLDEYEKQLKNLVDAAGRGRAQHGLKQPPEGRSSAERALHARRTTHRRDGDPQ